MWMCCKRFLHSTGWCKLFCFAECCCIFVAMNENYWAFVIIMRSYRGITHGHVYKSTINHMNTEVKHLKNTEQLTIWYSHLTHVDPIFQWLIIRPFCMTFWPVAGLQWVSSVFILTNSADVISLFGDFFIDPGRAFFFFLCLSEFFNTNNSLWSWELTVHGITQHMWRTGQANANIAEVLLLYHYMPKPCENVIGGAWDCNGIHQTV